MKATLPVFSTLLCVWILSLSFSLFIIFGTYMAIMFVFPPLDDSVRARKHSLNLFLYCLCFEET